MFKYGAINHNTLDSHLTLDNYRTLSTTVPLQPQNIRQPPYPYNHKNLDNHRTLNTTTP